MKIALKYGLLITAGVVAWVIVAHWLVPNPQSKVHSLGAGVFFNLLEIVAIYLGISERKRTAGGSLKFKEALKSGVSIAFVYGISACLFFLIELLIIGPRLMQGEVSASNRPLWQVVLGAFAGLLLGAVVFGLIYSTIISFVLASRIKAGE